VDCLPAFAAAVALTAAGALALHRVAGHRRLSGLMLVMCFSSTFHGSPFLSYIPLYSRLCNVIAVQVAVQSAHTSLAEKPGLIQACNQLQRERLR
jgi:hypothetical protein